jgi:hypothetical protein
MKLAEWFGLQFQVDGIDYSRPHFVHADLTAEEFAAAGGGSFVPRKEGEQPGDPAAGLPPQIRQALKQMEAMLPMVEQMLGQPGPMRDAAKRMIASMLGREDVDSMIATVMPGLSELLIDKRNVVVVERLKERAPETKGSIAIFYGAAHMRDLETRIVETLGYRRGGARWLRAWEIE